jgi:hypothetical protein
MAEDADKDEPAPRHEFRTFSETAPPGWARIRREGQEEAPRADLYLLSRDPGDALLKIRDLDDAPALDLKRLVSRHGELELWRPAGRAELPAEAETARPLLDAAGLPPPASGHVGIEELRELGGVRAVRVTKRRTTARIGGATAEATALEIDGAAACTVAVEAEDPREVEAARTALGLGDLPNESYGAYLRRVADRRRKTRPA